MADAAGLEWLEEMVAAADPRGVLLRFRDSLSGAGIHEIHREALASVYADPARASRLAECASVFAEAFPDTRTLAAASRICANVAYASARYDEARHLYCRALDHFRDLGDEAEEGRTLSSGLQTLILLGDYDEARVWADRAEGIFLRLGDTLRLARLDSNVGNLHFRLDQHRAAITRYERALSGFGDGAAPTDTAAVLINLAACYTGLGEFAAALEAYRRARAHCADHGLARLTAQTDYNIAWLWYLRGDYREARRLYALARQDAQTAGDWYHSALCDLDESELYLELSLTSEGLLLARRASEAFAKLAMRYEHAKALVSVAVAENQAGDSASADRTLRAARSLFVAEGNAVWPAVIDLLRGVLAFREGRTATAKRLGAAAWKALAEATMPGKATQCLILLARVALRDRLPDRAQAIARQALMRLGVGALPSLRFHCNLLLAECAEAQGRSREAQEYYEAARLQIEEMRGRVDTEDLRISVLADKLQIYESLVSLCLEAPGRDAAAAAARALGLIQEAKSRTLSDRLMTPDADQKPLTPAGRRSTEIREELTWYYRQIELAGLLNRQADAVTALRSSCTALENELLLLTKTAAEQLSEHSPEPLNVHAVQALIPIGTAALEYYEARGQLWVLVVTADRIQAVRLGASAPVWRAWKLLRFQLGACVIHNEDACRREFSEQASVRHLTDLYDALVRPVGALPEVAAAERLVIAPHGALHGVPFAALYDSESKRYLTDRFELVTTPSLRTWAACRLRPEIKADDLVIVAVPDPRAPAISLEAEAIRSLFPEARLVAGDGATSEALLRESSRPLGVLHLAAHGVLRRDNPMFSCIQLADGPLSVYDLRQHRLEVGLVVLSACNTGTAVAVAGDELLGVTRGFLAAGARNLLVSLWEVDDDSTAEFMTAFYGLRRQGVCRSAAVRKAMQQVRRTRSHPWNWAAFCLVGAGG